MARRTATTGHDVGAKGHDGHGWYIIEVDKDGRRALRHWARYNLKEAAESSGKFMFPEDNLIAMWWDGQWHDEQPDPLSPHVT